MKYLALTFLSAIGGMLNAQSVFNASNNQHICSLNLEQCVALFPDGISSGEMHTNVLNDSTEEEGTIHEIWFSDSGASESHSDVFLITRGGKTESFTRVMSETQYSIFDNFMVYMGSNGYGAFDVFEYYPIGGDSILVKISCAGHCNPDDDPRYDVVVRKNNRPYQLFLNVAHDGSDDFNHRQFLSSKHPDVIEYQFDNKNQLLCDRNSHGIPLMFLVYETPEETENWKVGNTPLTDVIQNHFGFKPTVLLLNVYAFGTLSFILDEQGLYYQGPSVFLEH